MAVNAIPNGSFGGQVGAADRVSQEQLYSPGAYSTQELQYERPRKRKGGFLGFLGKLAFTAVLVGGAAALGRTKLASLKDIDLKIKPGNDTKVLEKAKYYIAGFGEWTNEKVITKIVNLAKNKKQ